MRYKIAKVRTIEDGGISRRDGGILILPTTYSSLQSAMHWAAHEAQVDRDAKPGQQLFHGTVWWTRVIGEKTWLEYRVMEYVERTDPLIDHVGVKGMRWGVRKPDTFFNVVKKHYARSASGSLRHIPQDDVVMPMSRYSTEEMAKQRAYGEAVNLTEDSSADFKIVWDPEARQWQVHYERYRTMVAFEYQKLVDNRPAYPQQEVDKIIVEFRKKIEDTFRDAGYI